MDKHYAAICGFTIDEFDTFFSDHMEAMLAEQLSSGLLPEGTTVSDLRRLLLEWYDGYSWDGRTRVLNPWSVLKALAKGILDDYWAQSGGIPSFLVNLSKSKQISLNIIKNNNSFIPRMNLIQLGKKLNPIPLMFQAGYLSVDRCEVDEGSLKYYLDFPNFEVKTGILPFLLDLEPIHFPDEVNKRCGAMVESLVKLDAAGFQNHFGGYLACFPYQLHEPREGYYHSMLISAMYLAGAKFFPEESVGDGRYDGVYTAPDGTLFLFEVKHCPCKDQAGKDLTDEELRIKVDKLVSKALKQIEDRQYTKKYRNLGVSICKVALVIAKRTDVTIRFKKEDDIN
jgi:hypothetical protein